MQNRFKSKVLWVSLVSAIIAFSVNSGIIDTGMSQMLLDTMNTLVTILVGIGILNNPSDGERF